MAVSLIKTLALISATGLIVTGCNTLPENPGPKNASENQVQAPSPITYASNAPQTSAYSGAQATQTRDLAYEKCQTKETNREIAGAAIGGTVGAIAGDKIVGGTKGTLLGAAIGGTAGYGIGDKLVDCAPTPVQSQPMHTTSSGYTPAATSSYGQSAPITQPQAYVAPQPYIAPQPYPATGNVATAPTDAAYAGRSMAGTPGYEATAAVPVEYDYSQNIVSTASNAPVYGGETQIRTFNGATQSHTVRQGDTVYSLSRKLCTGIDEVQTLNNLGYDFAIKIGDNLTLPASRC